MKRILISTFALAVVLFFPYFSHAQQVPVCYLNEGVGQVEVTFGNPTITSNSINLNAPTAAKIKNFSGGQQLSPSLSVNWAVDGAPFNNQNARSFFNEYIQAGQTKPASAPASLIFTGLASNTTYNFYFFNATGGQQCPSFKIKTAGSGTVTTPPPTNPSVGTVTLPLITTPSTTPPTNQPSTPSPTPEPAPYKPALLSNPLKSEYNTIPKIITAVIKNIIVPLALPFLVIAFIWSGFLFVSARGNPEKLKKAKEAFTWTVIGAAVVLASFVIAEALQNTIEEVRGTTQSMNYNHEERISRLD